MEDIVLETAMFQRPPEWGRRVIQRGDEVLLQTTDNGGKTWIDAPIPEVKLIRPSTPQPLKSASTDTNKYSGISFYLRDPEVRQMTKSTIDTDVQISDDYIKSEILESINSGNLLTITEQVTESGQVLENISFLGVYRAAGLSQGQLWRDSDNYVRIVP